MARSCLSCVFFLAFGVQTRERVSVNTPIELIHPFVFLRFQFVFEEIEIFKDTKLLVGGDRIVQFGVARQVLLCRHLFHRWRHTRLSFQQFGALTEYHLFFFQAKTRDASRLANKIAHEHYVVAQVVDGDRYLLSFRLAKSTPSVTTTNDVEAAQCASCWETMKCA